MLKIYSTTPKKEENTRVKQKKRSHEISRKESSFNIALQNNISFNFDGTIEELLNELKEEEKRFLDRQTLYELNRYKSIVQKILKTILEEGVQTRTLKRLRKDRADYVIVDKINQKLMLIASGITNKENRAFNLMRSIEEIRGLIFDLVH